MRIFTNLLRPVQVYPTLGTNQGAAQEAGCVARCLRFEVVASFDEWQSGSERDLNNGALGEPKGCFDRADHQPA